ncbi:MAG TPA: hypothetical protein VGC18_01230 [Lacisediminihabitans sp.]
MTDTNGTSRSKDDEPEQEDEETLDEVADALPGSGRLGGDRPDASAPLP